MNQKLLKNILFKLSGTLLVTVPLVTVVACGVDDTNKNDYKGPAISYTPLTTSREGETFSEEVKGSKYNVSAPSTTSITESQIKGLFSASDELDGAKDITWTGTVDFTTPGLYPLVGTTTDNMKNQSQVTVNVSIFTKQVLANKYTLISGTEGKAEFNFLWGYNKSLDSYQKILLSELRASDLVELKTTAKEIAQELKTNNTLNTKKELTINIIREKNAGDIIKDINIVSPTTFASTTVEELSGLVFKEAFLKNSNYFGMNEIIRKNVASELVVYYDFRDAGYVLANKTAITLPESFNFDSNSVSYTHDENDSSYIWIDYSDTFMKPDNISPIVSITNSSSTNVVTVKSFPLRASVKSSVVVEWEAKDTVTHYLPEKLKRESKVSFKVDIDRGFYKDAALRATIANDAIKEDATYKIEKFTESDFTNKYNFFTGQVERTLYDEIYKIANVVLDNDDDILGWKGKNDSAVNPESAIIYFDGGPLPDIRKGSQDAGDYLYYSGRYGSSFALNQAQWGFEPVQWVYAKGYGTNASTNSYLLSVAGQNGYSTIAKQLADSTLTHSNAMRLIMGNIELETTDVQFAASVAFSEIDAQRALQFVKKLKDDLDYEKINIAGSSHGFWVASDVLLFAPGILDLVNGVSLEANSLFPELSNSWLPTGALLNNAVRNKWLSEGASDRGRFNNVTDEWRWDNNFMFTRMEWFVRYGHKVPFDAKLADPIYKAKLNSKAYFSFTEYDWNIGDITKAERDWYATNGMNIEARDGKERGHQQGISRDQADIVFKYGA